MANCAYCGNKIDEFPRSCKYCDHYFCSHHRLPESHECTGLKKENIFTRIPSSERVHEAEKSNEENSNYQSSEQLREFARKHMKNTKLPYDLSHKNNIKNKQSRSVKSSSGPLIRCLTYLICVMFLANIIFPFILLIVNPNMQFVLGNPKPIYFYDVSSSCGYQIKNIKSSLNYLSDETGVKFISLSYPFALLIGGISYDCTNSLTNVGAAGEAESGMFGVSFFIFAWNNVRLSDLNRITVVHETLHVMGFGHSKNSGSIMYPYAASSIVEPSLRAFIKKTYVNNPLAYLTIIPLNLFYEIFFLFSAVKWIISNLFFRKKFAKNY